MVPGIIKIVVNHQPTYSMSGEGCSVPVFEFCPPTMNTQYLRVSHIKAIKKVFLSQTSFLFLKSSLCSVIVHLFSPMNSLDFSHLLPWHWNTSSSFCPSVQLQSWWLDHRLHVLHPHCQGSHGLVHWVMPTNTCHVGCRAVFGRWHIPMAQKEVRHYHKRRLHARHQHRHISKHLQLGITVPHVREMQSPLQGRSIRQKKIGWYSSTEDIRLTASVAE